MSGVHKHLLTARHQDLYLGPDLRQLRFLTSRASDANCFPRLVCPETNVKRGVLRI